MIRCETYGLHETGSGLRFLLQHTGVSHLLGKVKLTAKVESRAACPHEIDINSYVDLPLPVDPLLEAFFPLPRQVGEGRIYTLSNTPDNLRWLTQAARLGSARFSGKPQWGWATLREGVMFSSNITPLHVHVTHHTKQVDQILSMAPLLPRATILCLPPYMARARLDYHAPQVSSDVLRDLPLEQIGAGMVRRYLLHQQPVSALWES